MSSTAIPVLIPIPAKLTSPDASPFRPRSLPKSRFTLNLYAHEGAANAKKELQKKIEPIQSTFGPTNSNSSEETKEATIKVQSAIILEILKKINCGKAHNDLTAICRLIAFLTGKSYSKIYNEVQKGICLTNYHNKEIEQANKILSDLNTDISINKDKQY